MYLDNSKQDLKTNNSQEVKFS